MLFTFLPYQKCYADSVISRGRSRAACPARFVLTFEPNSFRFRGILFINSFAVLFTVNFIFQNRTFGFFYLT